MLLCDNIIDTVTRSPARVPLTDNIDAWQKGAGVLHMARGRLQNNRAEKRSK